MTGDGADPSSLPETLDYDAWRSSLADEVLLGQRCSACGFVSATPRSACLECAGRSLETVELPTTGVVHSETSIEVAPEGFDDGGYRVGVVDLGDARILARLEAAADIGDEVSFTGVLEASGDPAPIFG